MIEKCGPLALAKCGKALYGLKWVNQLSDDLGLNDPKRVRQWLTGKRPVPPGVWIDIIKLLKQRKIDIETVLSEID